MNTLDKKYKELCNHILENGVDKGDRTGVGTLSTFGYMFRHDMIEGYPLLTSKKMAFKTMITELKWFLKGRTDLRYLNENGCKIWNGDAYKVYRLVCEYELETPKYTEEEFIQKIMEDDDFNRVWGELGPIYGKQWRNWEIEGQKFDDGLIVTSSTDQIRDLLHLLEHNPDSRRMMVNAWNVSDLPYMTLPPCHYGFQCYVNDDKLSLMWTQRSVDVFLGLPFNIASYGLLLLLLCEETGYKPGHLIGSLGDTHIYKNHIDAVKQQLNNDEYDLPSITLSNVDILMGEFDVELHNYTSSDRIKAELNN